MTSCLIKDDVIGYPKTKNYYIGDQSFQLSITLHPPLACAGLACIAVTNTDLKASAPADVTETWNAGTNVFTFKTDTLTRHGQVVKVRVISAFPLEMLAPCNYYFEHTKLNLKKVNIVPVVVPRLVYNLGDPQLNFVIPQFQNSLGITGDTRLDIKYSIKTMSDLDPIQPGTMFLAFDSNTRAFSVKTSDDTLPRYTQLKVVSEFKYIVGNQVE